MSEQRTRARVIKKLKKKAPWALVLRHEDTRTAGVPDASMSAGARTLWMEFKFEPGAEYPKLQRNNLIRLAGIYVVWDDHCMWWDVYAPSSTLVLLHGADDDYLVDWLVEYFHGIINTRG